MIQSRSDAFWKNLLLDEFGGSLNHQFMKLIDQVITPDKKRETNIKRKALLFRKIARKHLNLGAVKSDDTLMLSAIGPLSTGKSSLLVRFIIGEFVENIDPTLEDSYRKLVHSNGKSVVLDILDTAGFEEYIALRDGYIRTSQAYIINGSFDIEISKHANFYTDLLDQIARIKNEKTGFYFPKQT